MQSKTESQLALIKTTASHPDRSGGTYLNSIAQRFQSVAVKAVKISVNPCKSVVNISSRNLRNPYCATDAAWHKTSTPYKTRENIPPSRVQKYAKRTQFTNLTKAHKALTSKELTMIDLKSTPEKRTQTNPIVDYHPSRVQGGLT